MFIFIDNCSLNCSFVFHVSPLSTYRDFVPPDGQLWAFKRLGAAQFLPWFHALITSKTTKRGPAVEQRMQTSNIFPFHSSIFASLWLVKVLKSLFSFEKQHITKWKILRAFCSALSTSFLALSLYVHVFIETPNQAPLPQQWKGLTGEDHCRKWSCTIRFLPVTPFLFPCRLWTFWSFKVRTSPFHLYNITILFILYCKRLRFRFLTTHQTRICEKYTRRYTI